MIRLTVLLVLGFCWTSSVAADKDVDWGVWADKDQSTVYAFRAKNAFVLSYLDESSQKRQRLEGVWRQGTGVCWLGKQKGNVIIFIDNSQCCLSTESLGGKLVLTFVWVDPVYSRFTMDGFCSNGVLSKIRAIPDD